MMEHIVSILDHITAKRLLPLTPSDVPLTIRKTYFRPFRRSPHSSMMASFSEGLLLNEKVGLDPKVLVEVFSYLCATFDGGATITVALQFNVLSFWKMAK
ncbi:glyoxylate reductase (NADP(+)) [Trifolium repens]|nr:glyoxylate reductase (NADP(+)) [Trifolium repens]